MSEGSLGGQTAVVTGAGHGVGAAIAERLAVAGARVGVWDLDGDAAEQVAERIASGGGRALGATVDVTERDALAAALARTEADLGRPGILVNNAGVWLASPFVDSDPEQWRVQLEVNLWGVLHLTHLVLPGMIEQGCGRVVSIMSDSARTGEPNVAVYAGAKAAVGGFTRALAKEVGPQGITVNCVSLSTTVTPGAHRSFTPEQLERMPRFYPMRRLGRPDDAAGAVAYLASDEASWVTGQIIGVNGGYAMTP